MGGIEGGNSITNITIINPQIMGIWQAKKKCWTRDDTESMGVCVSVWSGVILWAPWWQLWAVTLDNNSINNIVTL